MISDHCQKYCSKDDNTLISTLLATLRTPPKIKAHLDVISALRLEPTFAVAAAHLNAEVHSPVSPLVTWTPLSNSEPSNLRALDELDPRRLRFGRRPESIKVNIYFLE